MFKFASKYIVNHPWLALLAWVIITGTTIAITLGGVTGSTIFDRLKTDSPTVASESQTGTDLINKPKITKTVDVKTESVETKKTVSETIFVLVSGETYKTENENLKSFGTEAKDYLDFNQITYATPYGVDDETLKQAPELKKLIADNSFMSTATITAENKTQLEAKVKETVDELNRLATKNHVSNVSIGAETLLVDTIIGQAETDLAKGESLAFPLALLVMVIVFGGLLAAGMPLIGAGVSIISALGTLYGLSYFMTVDTSTLNVLSVIGLGLSIDYGLLMISRFRETLRLQEHAESKENVKQAALLTLQTAGRTVIFSGITVAVSTLTLLLFAPELLKTIGFAATSVVLLAVLASTTLLPAIFVILGDKLIKPSFLQKIPGLGHLMRGLGDIAPRNGFFSHATSKVQKRPWVFAIASTLLLVVLTLPIAGMKVSNSGVDKLPVGTTQGTVFTSIKKDFPGLSAPDIILAVDGADDETLKTDIDKIETYLNSVNSIETETINVSTKNNVGKITFNVNKEDNIEQTVNTIREHNKQSGATNIYVTGETALDMDYVKTMGEMAPWVALIIMFVTGLLLFLMTGSALIPLKAVFLSVLSLGASIGVLTWGFQDGNLANILNFDPSRITGIDPLILVLTLTFGFGLAMDYEMFLVSRIKEKHAHGASTNLAVRSGLQASGRIITSAALMIVIVFIGFAMGDMLMIKMMGVALAFAVIIDATLVRMVLLPAIFTIFGDKIWWAPKWMKKIHNKIGVEH